MNEDELCRARFGEPRPAWWEPIECTLPVGHDGWHERNPGDYVFRWSEGAVMSESLGQS